MIEVLRQSNGLLLISAAAHCVESAENDRAIDAACKTLSELSGESRTRITVAVVRATMTDA